MCNFFSLVSNGQGEIWYFDAKIRKQILSGILDLELESHASIALYYDLIEDKCNKYEWHIWKQELTLDQQNTDNDFELVFDKCKVLDFGKIIPELIIKPVFNPFSIEGQFEETDIKLLKEWAQFGHQVRDQVWDQVRNQVWDQVGSQVWVQVWDQVGSQVWDQVGDQIWAQFGHQVRDQVWDQVRNQVVAYISSFFKINYDYNYTPAIKLWAKGLITSFDGKTWRLHNSKGIVYEEAIY